MPHSFFQREAAKAAAVRVATGADDDFGLRFESDTPPTGKPYSVALNPAKGASAIVLLSGHRRRTRTFESRLARPARRVRHEGSAYRRGSGGGPLLRTRDPRVRRLQ